MRRRPRGCCVTGAPHRRHEPASALGPGAAATRSRTSCIAPPRADGGRWSSRYSTNARPRSTRSSSTQPPVLDPRPPPPRPRGQRRVRADVRRVGCQCGGSIEEVQDQVAVDLAGFELLATRAAPWRAGDDGAEVELDSHGAIIPVSASKSSAASSWSDNARSP